MSVIANFVNRLFPSLAHHFASSCTLQVSKANAQQLEALDIDKIHIEYRPIIGALVPRFYWGEGEGDHFLPDGYLHLPTVPMIITRKGQNSYSVRAFKEHQSMSAVEFNGFIAQLIIDAITTINYKNYLFDKHATKTW